MSRCLSALLNQNTASCVSRFRPTPEATCCLPSHGFCISEHKLVCTLARSHTNASKKSPLFALTCTDVSFFLHLIRVIFTDFKYIYIFSI